MNKVLPLFLLLVVYTAAAQDTALAPQWGWKHGMVAGLTLTQVSFTDWTQGGENALAYTAAIQGSSTQDEPATNWSSSYKFAFGQARLAGNELRKTDDKIDIETILTYKLGSLINPYVSATLKTQFVKGYKYDAAGNKTPVSNFFDPGYLTQAAGVGYQPLPEMKTRLGLALREIVTSEFNNYADNQKTKVDGGLESVTEVTWKLEENILFTSKLELFSPFKALDIIVVRNDNSIIAKVNKYISVNLNVQLINEKASSPRTQVKETLALGLSYAIL